ncbi:extracellular solute-binding protein [Catenovulum maritimum]|uniref:Antibiotic ABC transporter substrate-binding protein n=1 Tax=Catenovulum maritimum TaxID=1513271 RepID=A0A0J8JNU3_9ALTE|nr:extracellular solute-binding protein [Catenovulum maritimum]KMT66306.1 antibiotic ABC transporter substrate-binding protein [Catenovulum maritimum]
MMSKRTHLLFTCLISLSTFFSFHSSATNSSQNQVKIIKSHAIAMRGEAKYPADFKHWDYVNPNAPKGGTIKTATQGTFDNFNRYAQRGSSPSGIDGLFDSLMTSNDDEIQVLYGLIAEYIEYPTDYGWAIFHINPKAKFQDGKAITAHDVEFSFNLFYTQGVPQFKKYFEGVTVKALDDSRVKFTLPKKDKALMVALADTTIFPQHYYQDKDFSEPFKSPPLGSGPYKVFDYQMGKQITYQIDPNYWAVKHPTNAGRLNFEFEKIDYYLDETVLLEAFKKGEYDFKQENVAKNWVTQYKGGNFENGNIVKEEISHQVPTGNSAFVFNVQKPQFQDRRVRLALSYLFDFEWTNKNFFYGDYQRNYSYFMNTDYASSGLPKGQELDILNQYKDKLPAELFSQAFELSKTDGSGNIRNQIRSALRLFKQAGYQLKDKKLVDKNGKQFEFELLLFRASTERVAVPFQQNIEKIGGKMNIRLVSDSSQYINRVRERDFDMISRAFAGYPTESLKIQWHTSYLNSTYNWVGANDPMIDNLVDKIAELQQDEVQLTQYARAFDRILLWNYYSIPQWHLSKYRVAYWNKFSRPNTVPKYDLGADTWWYDETKASTIKKN